MAVTTTFADGAGAAHVINPVVVEFKINPEDAGNADGNVYVVLAAIVSGAFNPK